MLNNRLLIFIFSIFFFVDPTVFFRVLARNDAISIALVLIFFVIILYKCLNNAKAYLLSRTYMLEFFLVIAYIVMSSCVHIFLGQALPELIQHEVLLIQCLFLFLLLLDRSYQKPLISAFMLASIFHVLTIIPGFNFLTNSLAENTAYGTGEYSVGIFTRKATGFFNSPGQLSVFASGALALGLSLLKKKERKIGIILIINAVALGIAALSRSFFVICLFIVLVYILRAGVRTQLKFISIFILLIAFLSTSQTVTSYFDLINDRLSTVFSAGENDRLTGETGLFEVVKVIERYPFFGNPILDNGRGIQAWNGEIAVRPHFGILCLLCFYGLVLGIPIYILLFRGIRVMFIELFALAKTKIRRNIFLVENPFLLGFISLNIVCLVEPLLESSIYFFFLFGMLHFYKQRFMYSLKLKH